MSTTETKPKETPKPSDNGKWSAATAVDYVLANGAEPVRLKALSIPLLELPDTVGLKFLSAVDFLKKFYGVRQINILGVKYLGSLGRILQHITSR